MKLTLRNLLWVDCTAAGCVGLAGLSLTFAGFLGPALGLSFAWLAMMGGANLLYAACSLSLALAVHPGIARVRFLIRANLAWAVACLVMASVASGAAHRLGLGYLLAEAAFVGFLACLESGALKRHLLAT